MSKVFVLVVVAILLAIVEATHIKILHGIENDKYASAMTLKPACNDKKKMDPRNFGDTKQYADLIKNRPDVKFYSSKTAKDQLGLELNKALPGTKYSAGHFLEELRDKGCSTFIFGGAVRDTLLGWSSKDIDAETNCEPGKIMEICLNKFDSTLCHRRPRSRLVNFGLRKHVAEQVDMTSNWDTFYGPASELEYSPNALAFDYGGEDVIIDLCGTAVEDACKMKIRIPVPFDQWNAWATSRPKDNGKKIFRYWKLKAKGFKRYDKATEDFIIQKAQEYIQADDNWLPMKKYYCSIIYHRPITTYKTGEGCCQTEDDCKTKVDVQTKAKKFKDVVKKDLKNWKLPTCGDPSWGYY